MNQGKYAHGYQVGNKTAPGGQVTEYQSPVEAFLRHRDEEYRTQDHEDPLLAYHGGDARIIDVGKAGGYDPDQRDQNAA